MDDVELSLITLPVQRVLTAVTRAKPLSKKLTWKLLLVFSTLASVAGLYLGLSGPRSPRVSVVTMYNIIIM